MTHTGFSNADSATCNFGRGTPAEAAAAPEAVKPNAGLDPNACTCGASYLPQAYRQGN